MSQFVVIVRSLSSVPEVIVWGSPVLVRSLSLLSVLLLRLTELSGLLCNFPTRLAVTLWAGHSAVWPCRGYRPGTIWWLGSLRSWANLSVLEGVRRGCGLLCLKAERGLCLPRFWEAQSSQPRPVLLGEIWWYHGILETWRWAISLPARWRVWAGTWTLFLNQ